MIKSFSSSATEAFWDDRRSTALDPRVTRRALRKLNILHSATTLRDLRSPPGNCLEALSGDRAGQHSIRINSQWRICFRWDGEHAHDVEIVDYH